MVAGYWATRTANGIRKVLAGLRPWNESVWPGVSNDLFVAHQSVYEFFRGHVAGSRVIDAGCGTGYGSEMLAKAGALSVTGVDIDRLSIRFARRHYSSKSVSFVVGDIHTLPLPDSSADLVVASNALEHLVSPEKFLVSTRRVAPRGDLLLAVPPILSEWDLRSHNDIHYHRSNYHVAAWHALFLKMGYSVTLYAHRLRNDSTKCDFASPFPSNLSTEDFVVKESSLDDILRAGAIAAIFRLTRDT